MLILIGGASRSGKSILTRRLLKDNAVPYFSLDMLMMGLVHGVPQLGANPDASSIARAEHLWPVVRAICVNILETGIERYCIEGDYLLPGQVQELSQAFPGVVRCCFLGYAEADAARKVQEIRSYSDHPNDWLRDYPDDYVRELAEEMIGFSRYLQTECARLGLPYVDTSADFVRGVETALAQLKAGLPAIR
jgi:hypothetical protein